MLFDSRVEQSDITFDKARKLILFGTNLTDNIYVIGFNFTQGLQYGKTIKTKSGYKKVNPNEPGKNFVLSVNYNGDNSYLFVNGIQQIQFTAASDQSIFKNLLTIGNVTKDFSTTYQERTGLYGDIYDFAVDYVPADTPKIYDIHRYLMKKMALCKPLNFSKKV